ncbi:MAG TPA: YkgJ family cysteine cluster protein [Steroidobacteraceae bacterium]
MEIEIDEQLVDAIVRDELEQARADLKTLGPVAALVHSQQRHDERLAAAADAPTLACKNGCYWCCYFTVDVRAVEVFRILEVMATFDDDIRARAAAEIRTNAAALAGLDDEARLRHTLKCPFLRFGRCSIYLARPQTCRNYHATSSAGCAQAFREPDNDDIDPEFAPLVYQSGGAHVDAFASALKEAGYDAAVYELNGALAAALADPHGTRARFEAGEPPFPSLVGRDVDPEFIESR